VTDLGLQVYGLGLRVKSLELRVIASQFTLAGSRVERSGFRVWSLGRNHLISRRMCNVFHPYIRRRGGGSKGSHTKYSTHEYEVMLSALVPVHVGA
jgi:hypothetical protein